MTPPKEITELKEAIRALHGCDALYVRTMRVDETFDGVMPRYGLVMVFELVGHREAACCYAWNSGKGEQTETFVVLQIPPVTTPASALQAALEARAGRLPKSLLV